MPTLSQADQLLYSTVRLSTFAMGAPTGFGTGFFYTILDRGAQCVVLVTNKHVIDGSDEVRASFHVGTGDPNDGPTGRVRTARLPLGPRSVAFHPDPSVDLCAVCISGLLDRAHGEGAPIFYVSLTAEIIPTQQAWENFDAIEDVLMVGCPNGIFDEVNNIPIVRRGISATPLSKPYNGASQFLIDMACFPGSSGSPVFIYDKHGFFDRAKNQFALGAQRQFFVGVLYSGPVIANDGEIILTRKPRVEVSTMMHLGCVIRSSEMFPLEDAARKMIVSQSAA